MDNVRGLIMSLFPRSTGTRTTNINDAVRDMEVNGDNMPLNDTSQQYTRPPMPPGHVPPQEEFGMAMYGTAPPTQPPPLSGYPTQAPQGYYPSQPTEPSVYLFISYNKDTESTKVEQMDETSVMARLEELGLGNSLAGIPTTNPAHWAGKFLIIKGSVVVPKEVRTIKLV